MMMTEGLGIVVCVYRRRFFSFVLVTGAAYEQALNQLMEMGFDRNLATRAMRKAFNNPDRAVEYLMSGNVNDTDNDNSGPEGGAAAEPEEQGGRGGGSHESFSEMIGQDVNASMVLEMFRNDPQFRQLRHIIQRNPTLLEPTLQEIAYSNPMLMEVLLHIKPYIFTATSCLYTHRYIYILCSLSIVIKIFL
jgi:UV excision repair protein RAD23